MTRPRSRSTVAKEPSKRHRDEALRVAAHEGLAMLRTIVQPASMSPRAASLGLKAA